jgi:hypothetical protein
VTRASRFLTGLVMCFATHDGIPARHRTAGGTTAGALIHEWLPSRSYRDSASEAWASVLDRLDRILTTSG